MEVLAEWQPGEVLESWALSSSFALCISSSCHWSGSFTISFNKLARVSLSSVSRSSEIKELRRRLLESIAGESEAQLTDQGMCLGSQVAGRGAVLKDWTLNLWNLMLPSVDCSVLCVWGGESLPCTTTLELGPGTIWVGSVESHKSSWERVVGLVRWVYITKIKMRKDYEVLHERVWNLHAYKDVLNIAVLLMFSHKFWSILCK